MYIPNIRHLQVFREVAHRGSVSAAARAANLSQPAVSQAVFSLEDAFEAVLFRRTPTGMQISDAGRALASRVTRALDRLGEGCGEVGRRGTRGPLGNGQNPLMGITAAQLNVLIAVSEHGGFGSAARSLEVARPTLHRAARQLERVLGAALFEQTSFGLRATREAERLARCARLAFNELGQARAELASLEGAATGRTVIGALPLARSLLVPNAVLEFAATHPEHAISLLDGPYDSMVVALRRGAADVLIGALRNPPTGDDVVQEHLFDDPLALIMRAGHPLAANAAPTLGQLAGFPWLAPRRGSPLRGHFETLVNRMSALGLAPPAAPIECNSLVASRAMLLASDRLMLLSAHQIHHERAAGQLIALPHPLGPIARPIGLTLRRDWAPTAAQSELLEVLRRQARAFTVAAPSGARNAGRRMRNRRATKRMKWAGSSKSRSQAS